MNTLGRLYQQYILGKPAWVLALLSVFFVLMAYQARLFELDASAESLMLEEDKDLAYWREVNDTYGTSSFLFLLYEPKEPLFSEASLTRLQEIRDRVQELALIDNVNSILDVPLLENPPGPMTELVGNIKTLEQPEADAKLAAEELSTSPLYNNLLLNLDNNITAIQLNLPIDKLHQKLIAERQAIYETIHTQGDSPQLRDAIEQQNRKIRTHNTQVGDMLHNTIGHIRAIMADYDDDQVTLRLGGVPMIADDMLSYVRSDLTFFGIGVLVLLIITLSMIFRQLRWVAVSILCCSAVVISMLGLLGTLDWKATVISSNVVSLLLILTMSTTIHLMVRYRELLLVNPKWTQKELVAETISAMVKPCLFMALTTIVSFVSLVISGIRPVIDFGWMLTLGMVVSFVVTFLLFPAIIMLLPKAPVSKVAKKESPLTHLFAWITRTQGTLVLLVGLLFVVTSAVGISKLKVENSFIDYFAKSTEIYRSMALIDQNMGGTTPLDVLIDFPQIEEDEDEYEDDFEDFDDFEEFEGSDSEEEDNAKYWFTTDKIRTVQQVHDYLDALPETGKVLSIHTMMSIAERLNGEPLDNFQLALLYGVIPSEFKDIVLKPFVSIENSQARISLRMVDSNPDLNRNEFLKRIKKDIVEKLGIEEERVHLSGMMVLYNNMLQSLFKSQILTLGAVFIGILVMFLVLFRSVSIALIGIIPNLLAAAIVMSVMGWFSIPLDMMTITIAAISIGIAVDNSIHYIFRMRLEFNRQGSYIGAMESAHGSIGRAMYYTSITIILGFSILVVSNFWPTIYFGTLTALAMLVALVFSLTLLPRLIIWLKPFGKEPKREEIVVEKNS